MFLLKEDVLEQCACKDCQHFYRDDGIRPSGEHEPPENYCKNGDFGEEKLCSAIKAILTDGLDKGYDSDAGLLASAAYFEDEEKDFLLYTQPWSTHKYWFIPRGEGVPKGYDSLREVWNELFE